MAVTGGNATAVVRRRRMSLGRLLNGDKHLSSGCFRARSLELFTGANTGT